MFRAVCGVGGEVLGGGVVGLVGDVEDDVEGVDDVVEVEVGGGLVEVADEAEDVGAEMVATVVDPAEGCGKVFGQGDDDFFVGFVALGGLGVPGVF